MTRKSGGKTRRMHQLIKLARKAKRMRALREAGVSLYEKPELTEKEQVQTDWNFLRIMFPEAPIKDLDIIMGNLYGPVWLEYRQEILAREGVEQR